MNINGLQRKAAQLVSDNSAGILTGVGIMGTIGTAVLTGRASFKAAEILEQRRKSYEEACALPGDPLYTLTKKDKIITAAPLFIPPVLAGTATITAIFMANRMSAQKAAALAAAYGLSEGRFKEYREKVEEKLGVKKEGTIRDEIAQDRVTANAPSKEVIVLTSGEVLCMDMFTGRYFRSSVETIKRAENSINEDLFDQQYASLTDFYNLIGLEGTTFSDELGWNRAITGLLEIKFSTAKTPDNEPCITMDFAKVPMTGYQQIHS